MLRLATLALVLALLPAASHADDAGAGFGTETLAAPFRTTSVTLSSGEFVVLGTIGVYIYSESGVLTQTLHSWFNSLPPAAIAVDPTESFVVVSRSDGALGGTYKIDLSGGGATLITFHLGIDIVFGDADTLYLSVTSFIASVTEVIRIEISTGAASRVIDTQGTAIYSMARDAAGNLYVPTGQFDGPWSIYMFTPSQLASGIVLNKSDGVALVHGLSDVRGIAVEPNGAAIYVAEFPFLVSGTGAMRVQRLARGAAPIELMTLTTEPGSASAVLQLRPGTGPAQLLPYQPNGGGELIIQLDGGSPARHSLTAQRTIASVSGVGTSGTGPFSFDLTLGPPNGRAVLFVDFANQYNPVETYFPLAVPLAMGLSPLTAIAIPGLTSFDSNGTSSTAYVNGTGTPGVWALQAILLGSNGKIVGSSTATFL